MKAITYSRRAAIFALALQLDDTVRDVEKRFQ
jgi:hypothetical protein